MAHQLVCKVNVNVLSCIHSYLPVFFLATGFTPDLKHGIFMFWIFHILGAEERKNALGRQGENPPLQNAFWAYLAIPLPKQNSPDLKDTKQCSTYRTTVGMSHSFYAPT